MEVMGMRSLAMAVLLLGAAITGRAQHDAGTGLVLRIDPEAWISPKQSVLQFQVSGNGSSDVMVQAATVSVRARARPGQPVLVTARMGDIAGPGGSIPASAVRWTGSVVAATGGGAQASCSKGVFVAGAVLQLVEGWIRPGSVT